MTGFAKRDHLGLRSDFELDIWSESTLDELPVAFYCTSLAATVFEMRWLELRNYANHYIKKTAFESLLPVNPSQHSAFCRVTNDVTATWQKSDRSSGTNTLASQPSE